MDIKDFIKVFPPPPTPIYTGDALLWDELERRHKISFPKDYKQFIDAYGFCSIEA